MRINRLFHSIQGILIIALILRILAAVFARGYAFHDDHFDVLRVAEAWTEGIGHWIYDDFPPKHSFFYTLITAFLLAIVKFTGISDPMVKVAFLQLFHGLYSLLIVWLGYLITLRLSSRENALRVALILAVLWFMPYLGVKFMAELVSVPPLMFAFLLLIRDDDQSRKKWLLIGLMIALAFTVRIHTIFLAGGIGLILIYSRKWKEILLIVVSFLFTIFFTIGIPDLIFFGYPFESLVNYFLFNTEDANQLITAGPFKYLGTIAGFLVPPVSLMLLWGYGRSFRINPALFMGVLLFFVFHSAFPHKQERFILPIFPFLIILGTIGWQSFASQSRFWLKHPRFLNGCWAFFWGLNIIAALFMSFNYTKKDRVAPLHYLSQQENMQTVLLDGRQGGLRQPPAYYLGERSLDYGQFDQGFMGYQHFWERPEDLPEDIHMLFTIDRVKSMDSLQEEFNRMNRYPDYVVFYRDDSLEYRKLDMSRFLNAELDPEKSFEPSMLDKLLNFFNPRIHKRNNTHIYRVQRNSINRRE